MSVSDSMEWNEAARIARFWRSRWPISLVVIAWVLEVPGLIIMDWEGVRRAIFGMDTLRIAVARALGIGDPTLNIVGWMRDLDKIIAYLATLIVIFGMRRMLGGPEGHVITRGEYRSSIIAGCLGAAAISFHYGAWFLGSSHWWSFEDKGLINAIAAILRGEWEPLWIGLFAYRASYLLLAPVVCFLLFQGVFLLLVVGASALERANNEGDAEHRCQELNRFLDSHIVAAAPIPLLLGVHFVFASLWGMEHFKIERGRIVMVPLLWLAAPFSFAYLLHGLGRGLVVGDVGTWLGRIYARVKHALSAAGIDKHKLRTAILCCLAATPIVVWGFPLNKPTVNRVLGASNEVFVADYHNLPSGANAQRRLLSAMFPVARNSDWHSESQRALGLLLGMFLYLGADFEEMSSACKVGGMTCAGVGKGFGKYIRDRVNAMEVRFPMYLKSGMATRVRKLLNKLSEASETAVSWICDEGRDPCAELGELRKRLMSAGFTVTGSM